MLHEIWKFVQLFEPEKLTECLNYMVHLLEWYCQERPKIRAHFCRYFDVDIFFNAMFF